MDTIKIASYQGPIVNGDFAANHARVVKVYAQAATQGVDFVCFPECFLSGYTLESCVACEKAIDAPEMQALAALTRGGPAMLVGFTEKRDTKRYNSVAVYADGNLLGVQTKTQLCRGRADQPPESEAAYANSELGVHVFEHKGIKFGVCICHTTSFPEPAMLLRLKGARLLFTPHFNNLSPDYTSAEHGLIGWAGHREMVLNNQAGLATLLKMVVVRSNIITAEPDALGSGDSNIWDMNGRLVAAGMPFVEQLVTAEFPKEIFLREHWIDRRQVPLNLYEQILEAAREYLKDTPYPHEILE